jgi:hypothetical protein
VADRHGLDDADADAMKLFLHTPTRIRIVNEDDEFSCSPAAFAGIEPEYPGLPPGSVYRYWTPGHAITSTADNINMADTLNCTMYIEKVGLYNKKLPVIYFHLALSQQEVCVNRNPPERIRIQGTLKPSLDPANAPISLDLTWLLRLRHENSLAFDSFQITFVGGVCEFAYQYFPGLPLGVWSIQDSDFEIIRKDGQWYAIKLAQPISFTVYRELPT